MLTKLGGRWKRGNWGSRGTFFCETRRRHGSSNLELVFGSLLLLQLLECLCISKVSVYFPKRRTLVLAGVCSNRILRLIFNWCFSSAGCVTCFSPTESYRSELDWDVQSAITDFSCETKRPYFYVITIPRNSELRRTAEDQCIKTTRARFFREILMTQKHSAPI